MLEAIFVFWHSFVFIPKGAIEKISKSCFNVFGGGMKMKEFLYPKGNL